MRYLDTGSRDAEQTLYRWLEFVLKDARFFASQSAYFSWEGIEPFSGQIEDLLAGGGHFHLVIGANRGSVKSADLLRVLDLIEPHGERASLTLVGAEDVLMHPKTFYVEATDGTRHIWVGSANLTGSGTSANIEAAISASSEVDEEAPFDEVRDAVLAWLEEGRENVRAVTRSGIADLQDEGIVDAPEPALPPEPPEQRERRRRSFPRLGRLVQRGKLAGKKPPPAEGRPPLGPVAGLALPGGAVGIVKVLSRLDTKTFRGASGTAYAALPRELAGLLPLAPAGKNDEPRVDITLTARWDLAPTLLATDSRPATTNITHVGAGKVRRSNPDLRLNFLSQIAQQVLDMAKTQELQPPQEGDLLAVEFTGPQTVRMTFITDAARKAQLADLIDHSRGQWGWLPPGSLH